MNEEKAQQKASTLLAVMISLTIMLSTIAWAISVYFIERDRARMRIELARLATRAQQEEMNAIEPH